MESAVSKLTEHHIGLLDNDPAADYIGIKGGTLEVWRSTKRHQIPYIKVGRKIKYRKSDLDAWLKSRTVQAAA